MINEEINISEKDVYKLISKSLAKKVAYSLNLIKRAEKIAVQYQPQDGFYVGVSGGKDSQVVWHLAKMANVKFKAVMEITTIDPPESVKFVRREYPSVFMDYPRKSFWTMCEEKGCLPNRFTRFCCSLTKENKAPGYVKLLGVRHEESTRRSKQKEVQTTNGKYAGSIDGLDNYRAKLDRNKYNPWRIKGRRIKNDKGEWQLGCIQGKESLNINPIIYWTEKNVWEFLNAIGAKHCSLYDKDFQRVGCLLCPLIAHNEEKRKQLEQYPYLEKRFKKLIMKIYIEPHKPICDAFLNPSEHFEESKESVCNRIFRYYLSGLTLKEYLKNGDLS